MHRPVISIALVVIMLYLLDVISMEECVIQMNAVRLDGKTVIITGANTGLGKETAIERNAKVIACKNAERGKKAERDIRSLSKNENVLKLLDLASFASIRKFCSEVLAEEPRLDILINNAGIMGCPYWKTEDSFEMQFGVNHLGHFLLTNLLLDRIKEAPAGRIVVVSSLGYIRTKEINFDDINSTQSYEPLYAYGQANNLFAIALHKRLAGTNVTINCYILDSSILSCQNT